VLVVARLMASYLFVLADAHYRPTNATLGGRASSRVHIGMVPTYILYINAFPDVVVDGAVSPVPPHPSVRRSVNACNAVR